MVVTVKVRNLVEIYFKIGLTHDEMLCFLAVKHRIIISKRTLQRICRQLSLHRRKNHSDILEVATFIKEQLQGCGKFHGYRWMHLRCIQAGLNIPRNHVYYILQILDPEGVKSRKRNRLKRRQYKSKGPNNVWHIDGYDKLKPFGICIHGCIDGFSRKVLWMEASSTNSDPKVVAGYFISTVLEAGGCPQWIRADMGTENSYIRDIQMFLRRHHDDPLSGGSSFMYGKSVCNQRIEWFWGTVRKKVSQYWMNLFKDFQEEENPVFDGSFLDMNILRFCFMEIIQLDLDNLRETWNSHTISPQGNITRQDIKSPTTAKPSTMSVELTNIRLKEDVGQSNPAYVNNSDENLTAETSDTGVRHRPSSEAYDVSVNPDGSDEDYNACQRGVNTVQESIVSFYKKYSTQIWWIIGSVLLILYFVYFAYALSYKFGDEGSIRLLWVTVVAVVLGLLNLMWDYFVPALEKIGGAFSSPDNKRILRILRWFLYLAATIAIVIVLIVVVGIPNPQNLLSLAGLAAFLVICYVTSTNPGKVNWHPVFWGLAIQFFFACIILKTQWGFDAFEWLGDRVTEFLKHTDAGSTFVFGNITIHFFAFSLMPVVTFFSAVISVTYYLGIMQAVVRIIGRFLAFCLGTTPAESLSASGNIFVGQTEAPLMIKPFLETMTGSELHAVMTGGFATIAGSVLGAYIGFGVPANHLISASVMSAPAALAISKLMCPETEQTQASSEDYYKMKSGDERNIIEAASNGASMSIKLIANIVVNLIAFLAFLAFFNATLGWLGDRAGVPGLTFEFICSYVLYPVALFMGTRPEDCRKVAELVGIKTFTNEFIAYDSLRVLLSNRQTFLNYTVNYGYETNWTYVGDDVHLTAWNMTLKRGFMEERSEVISTYALCGFANIGSMGIMLGGLSALAPNRKPVLAKLVLRAMMAGNIACFLTACIAGLFFTESRFGTFELVTA